MLTLIIDLFLLSIRLNMLFFIQRKEKAQTKASCYVCALGVMSYIFACDKSYIVTSDSYISPLGKLYCTALPYS